MLHFYKLLPVRLCPFISQVFAAGGDVRVGGVVTLIIQRRRVALTNPARHGVGEGGMDDVTELRAAVGVDEATIATV